MRGPFSHSRGRGFAALRPRRPGRFSQAKNRGGPGGGCVGLPADCDDGAFGGRLFGRPHGGQYLLETR